MAGASRVERRPLKPPKNLIELVFMVTEAILMLGYTESRYVSNLPKAILHAVSDKGKKTVGRECGERSDCVKLKAPEMIKELYELKKCLTRTMLFSSRKRFLAFLLAAGIEEGDILLRKRTARILRPAFTIIRDKETKRFFVFIRGTHSLKDMLTDAFCAPVSFDHFICSNKMVSGHAHRGMLAAASWIQKHCTRTLKKALYQYPDFKIKIVGHSLGGGTAALLTYKLREIPQFSSTTCVTFGPAACMTLELAEFGKSFITSIVNGSDIVPTLSASSVHDFMSDDDEGRSKDKSILSTVGSHFPITKAIAKHAVTSCAEVVMKHKHGTRSLFPWHQRENNIDTSSSTGKLDNTVETYGSSANNLESLLIHEEHLIMESVTDDDEYSSSSEESDNDGNSDDDEDELSNQVEKLKLGKEDNNIPNPNIHFKGKEASLIVESSSCTISTQGRRRRLYPPGRIMHIVPNSNHNNGSDNDEKHVICLYETPRELYGKLRLSKRMIHDHHTKKYLKMLQQLIDQLEKEQFKYRG